MSDLPINVAATHASNLTVAAPGARQLRNAAHEYLNTLGSELSKAGMRSKLGASVGTNTPPLNNANGV